MTTMPASSSAPKRKRTSASTSTGSKKSKKASSSSSSAANLTTANSSSSPPLHTLILDNGGDTVKYGWLEQQQQDDNPRYMPNLTARLPQQWTVLVGDELQDNIQNPSQLLNWTRSTERGIITNMGNQLQVWKRILTLLGVQIPPALLKTMGWKQQQQQQQPKGTTSILPNTCVVFMALPPFCPRVVLDQIHAIWTQDFGFAHVGFGVSSVCAALTDITAAQQSFDGTCCVVDMGWSATHIVPVLPNKRSKQQQQDTSKLQPCSTAIRRLSLGGRHLIQCLAYYMSYRQWNLMDATEWLLKQQLLEGTDTKSLYVSLDFDKEMHAANQLTAGKRPYDREFLLPDFQNTLVGQLRLPPALLLQQQQEEKKTDNNNADNDTEDNDDDDDESVQEKDMQEQDKEDTGSLGSSDNDDEEETAEQAKQRLLQQRQQRREQQQLLAEQQAEQQILNLSVERFAIPELLFRPGDGGLPLEWANLPTAIVQSIQACPEPYRPALYQSIRVVGGLAQLENLAQRLEREVRAEMPAGYPLCIQVAPSPKDAAWHGACRMAKESPYTEWSVSYPEWKAAAGKGAFARLFQEQGGNIV